MKQIGSVKIKVTGVLVAILCSVLVALPISATEYSGHGIAFQIPANWTISDDQQINGTQSDGSSIFDTKITLSDSISTIRIDLIEIPQYAWIRNIYRDNPHYEANFLENFYRSIVLNSSEVGGSLTRIWEQDLLLTSRNEGREWTLIWALPDKFLGVYAIFEGKYPIIEMRPGDHELDMPMPLYEILESIALVPEPGQTAPNESLYVHAVAGNGSVVTERYEAVLEPGQTAPNESLYVHAVAGNGSVITERYEAVLEPGQTVP
ncbi:MAG: hypothetical protein XD72_0916 [Methanothrix harundinacea]|uniref:Uncharacterized protein n=1 Tax=Methanothrix harundinacea TaxID=301375 RepID=A0A117LFS1_9EURY|nr:MAG: hypothetical protein XD72_0916 [Methanothrix harundinacea]